MSPKVFVKDIIRRFGYDLIKYSPDHFAPRLDITSRLMRAYIEDLLRSNPDFFFIQVGANDGIQFDPIRESIRAHHLRGLLIEPLPDAFAKLCQNYQSEPQLLFENVAIGDKPGRLPFYTAKPGVGAPTWQVLASFDKANLTQHGVPEDCIESILLEVTTLPSLLEKHGIKDVTLLQVDTEGYDYRVVKSALDAGIRPKIINYEHIHLNQSDRLACKRMLYDAGYRFAEVVSDTVCYLNPDKDQLA